MMNIEVNGANIQVKLYDNSSASGGKGTAPERPFDDFYEGLCSHGEIRQFWCGASYK